MAKTGEINRVAGPVVTAIGISPKMYDVIQVGHEKLMGEVIKIVGNKTVIQVYEDTSGIRPGEPCVSTGLPLVAELGPGLLGSVYDGILRPLPDLMAAMGDFIKRGVAAPGLDRKAKYEFTPLVKKGDKVTEGQILGTAPERSMTHRILVPNGVSGTVEEIKGGNFTVDQTVAVIGGKEVMMMQRWPVRFGRPVRRKLMPDIPLLTGQRILDTLFPISKGGTAAIPGGFGTGKTVTQQQLAKWSDADIVVYIGCGERGNEMTEVLTLFPELEDPKTKKPLMNRTVLIANTSNMPVAAREASVYTGVTIAEYYRDMGLNVSLMADSTSRWAEALREISSRLEEMPGEEGYPAYLAAKLSAFYERSGRVQTLSGADASVTIVGAVSPPGGDFSEPVTQNTLRIVKVFWALDSKLAQRRHFPAINWLNSYSLYGGILDKWYNDNVSPDWTRLRSWTMETLQKEAELQEIVQLVGSDALPEEQQLLLEVARMIREIFLQQNAYHEMDSFCPMSRQHQLLSTIQKFSQLASRALEGHAPLQKIASMRSKDQLAKARFEKDFDGELKKVVELMGAEFEALGK